MSINLLLADFLDRCVLVYMDNILIYSKTGEEHIAHVKAVFECLAAKNWHVKEKKCALLLPEVEFLGHVVSAAGVKVAVDKVDSIASSPTPTCVCEVQGFLGLANFYRWFVKGFAAITKPLTNLPNKAIAEMFSGKVPFPPSHMASKFSLPAISRMVIPGKSRYSGISQASGISHLAGIMGIPILQKIPVLLVHIYHIFNQVFALESLFYYF